MSKICKCGKQFVTYPSKIKLGRGKYCSKVCFDKDQKGRHWHRETEWKKGTKPWSFKGWRYTLSRSTGKKYIQIYKPEWPTADSHGYVREHRYVMELYLKRNLLKTEIVHHKDGNTLNNIITNLVLMDKKDHDRMNTPLNVHKRWLNRR